MRRLYVLYDADCGLCSRVRRWAEAQPLYVDLEFIAAQSPRAKQWFPALVSSGRPEELVVVSDDGGVYREDNSWIMVLYAMRTYRPWAFRLSRPTLLPVAREAFRVLSENRRRLSNWMGLVSDGDLAGYLRQTTTPRCSGGTDE